jgi:hypothetical protein
LVYTQKVPGEHSVIWNGNDTQGSAVGSGMYFYRLEIERGHDTKSMILLNHFDMKNF